VLEKALNDKDFAQDVAKHSKEYPEDYRFSGYFVDFPKLEELLIRKGIDNWTEK
jgi:hypothetical protein